MSIDKSKIRTNEVRIKNADTMNVSSIAGEKFPEGTRLFLTTDSYTGEFKVIEVREEQGTQFRRIFGGRGEDVVVDLGFLQSEASRGNIKFIGEDGKIIEENDKR